MSQFETATADDANNKPHDANDITLRFTLSIVIFSHYFFFLLFIICIIKSRNYSAEHGVSMV